MVVDTEAPDVFCFCLLEPPSFTVTRGTDSPLSFPTGSCSGNGWQAVHQEKLVFAVSDSEWRFLCWWLVLLIPQCMLIDLHNGTVCGSSSSAERYSVDESEEERSESIYNDCNKIIDTGCITLLTIILSDFHCQMFHWNACESISNFLPANSV